MSANVFFQMSVETQIFIVVILLFNTFFHVRFTPNNALKAPAFLTTLGILGTFVGIALGLLHFDPDNVQKSIPLLIDGIKTAVWASALGIFCALTLKFREIMRHRPPVEGTGSHGATADDIANILLSVDQSLAGEGDESLIGQMKLARHEQAEHMQSFQANLASFYETMVEKNTAALVAALGEVIRDFNGKLNDQFGDNFRQLNEACEKLLVWQHSYGQQVGEMIAQQQTTSNMMNEMGARYETLVTQSESFNYIATSMGGLLAGLETQRTQMEGSLTALATLLNTAATGLPQMEEHLTEMTRQMTEGMGNANHAFNANMGDLIAKTKEQVLVLDAALSEELTKSLESFGRQMASLSEKFAADYGPITERLQAILHIGK